MQYFLKLVVGKQAILLIHHKDAGRDSSLNTACCVALMTIKQ